MSDNEKGNSNKEEVVVLAGVRARMAAYQQEISRKDKRKNTKPVFKVAEDLGTSIHSIDGLPVRDKMPVGEEQTDRSLSHNVDNDDDDAQAFQRSMNNSSKNLFDLEAGDEEDIEPEKPQEVKDEEENLAKQKISALLKRDDDETETGDEPEIVLQAFSAVQRRYLKAVQKLRPEPMAIKKPEKPEEAPAVKDVIRKKLNREMTKSTHLSELTMTWDDYYEKAQDKPTEETEVKQVEEEIKKVEEEVNSEWAEFAKEVVEIVGEEPGDSSAMEEDEDMVKWREEARRLKSEAEERKKQKAVREERKKKRAQIAALRKKRAEDAAKKKAEEAAMLEAEEETRRSELQRIEDERKATEEQTRARMEEAERKQVEEMATSGAPASKKKGDASDSDSDSSASSGSSSSGKERQAKAPTSVPPKKGRNKATGDSDSDSDSSVEEKAKKKSKKKKKKKDKDKEKKKEEDIIKVEEKKSKKKKKDGKKKGDEDSDLDDGWVEEYPRNLDGSLWKNPLKFWTNKPKKLNEVAPKVIMKVSALSPLSVCLSLSRQNRFFFLTVPSSFHQSSRTRIPISFAKPKTPSTIMRLFTGTNLKETSMCCVRSRET